MKRTILIGLIAAILLISVAGCGNKGSAGSGSSDTQAAAPEVESDNSAETVKEGDNSAEQVKDEGNAPSQSQSDAVPMDEISSGKIEDEGHGPSLAQPEAIPMDEIGSGKIEIEGNAPSMPKVTIADTDFSIEPINVAPPSVNLPDFEYKEFSVADMTISVPVIDYDISVDRIGSAYTDTFTVPELQVEIPDYTDEELAGVFISIADIIPSEDQPVLVGKSDAEFAKIAAVQLSLTDMLIETYKSAGITVAIDPMTGSIPIDTSLLFDTDKYELKPEGQAALKSVFAVYYSVFSRPEFRDAVDSIVIEGHTDTQGDHEYNQELSEQRAQAVYDFLLSDECGFPDRGFLQSHMTTVGRSYDDPVYAADGTVDLEASRRVEIHCVPKLDQ